MIINSLIDGSYILLHPDIASFVEKHNNSWKLPVPQGGFSCFCLDTVNPIYRQYVAEYIAVNYIDSKSMKVTTLHQKYILIKNFLNDVANNVSNITHITYDDIYDYVEELYSLNKGNKVFDLLIALKQFFNYYKKITDHTLLKQLEALIEKTKATQSQSLPLLPINFFNQLESISFKMLHNENLSLEDRVMAGLLIIQMEQGLRISELNNLQIQNFIYDDINDEYSMKFKVYKTATKVQKSYFAESPLSDNAVVAFVTIMRLQANFRGSSDALIIIKKEKYKDLSDFIKHVCLYNNRLLLTLNNSCYNECMMSVQASTISGWKNVEDVFPDDTLYYPSVHQFRVYRVTTLAERGVPLNRIALSMGHKELTTTNGYCSMTARYKDISTKYIYGEYTKNQLRILKSMAEDDKEGFTGEEKPVPNGTCNKLMPCEFKDYVIQNY